MMVLASQEARASETNRFSADDREYLGRTQTLLASRKGHSKLEFHPATVTALEDILPTVYVVAEGNDWLFNVSEIYWLLYGYRWWNGDFAFEGYVDCAAASALWFEQQEQLDSLIQDSVAVASAVAQVDNAMCVIQGTPLRMCLDFFISAKTAGPLNGDNRGFDTSAPYEASRVQVYLDLNSDSARVYLSPSSTWVPIMNGSIPTIIPPAAPYNHGAKSFQVTTIDATTKVVSFEFL